MAALYLHQALFANDTPSPPSLAHRNSRGPHDQFSRSTVTLRTSTSEHSHPTEPLLHGPYIQAAAYQDILASQPVYSEASRTSWTTGLSLTGDPLTSRERKREWERLVRRRLRRSRWARRVLKGIIAAWGVYNTVRYFVAFTIYTARDRQIALLVLGTASALSFAFLSLSILLSFFAPPLGWKHQSRSLYTRLQILLNYSASVLLLGPAVANIVFVAVWRRSPDPGLSLQGRCHWDIDVFWTGTGFQCDVTHAVAWGYWLAGAIVRLVFTASILSAYHFVSYQYRTTRVPSRRRRSRTHAHSLSFDGTTSPSTRSLGTMVSTATTPVSAPRPLRQSSYNSDSDFTHESGASAPSTSRPRKLRRSQSRVSADRVSSDGRARAARPLSGERGPPSADGHTTTLRFVDELGHVAHVSPSGSSDNLHLSAPSAAASAPAQDGSSRYGMPVGGAPSPASPSDSVAGPEAAFAAGPSASASQHPHARQADDMQHFVDRFRALVDQVTRETEDGMDLARQDAHDPYDPYAEHDAAGDIAHYAAHRYAGSANDDEGDYVPVMGKIIQRMPTIESLGSREVMSLASASGGRGGDRSVHTLSRPPTRANTLTMSEAAGSPSVSRSNSLTASIALASPVDAPAEHADANGSSSGGSRSSRSAYYAATGLGAGGADSAAAGPPARDAEPAAWMHHHEQHGL